MDFLRFIMLTLLIVCCLFAVSACGDDDDDDNDNVDDDDTDDDDDGDDDAGDDDAPSDDEGIFVAKNGSDDNPGTKAEPMFTVSAAVTLAETEGKIVFIAAGKYEESVNTTVSLYGGYDQEDWSRNIKINTTTISAQFVALTIGGTEEVVVEGLTIQGWGYGSKGVLVNNSATVLHQNFINGGYSAKGDSPKGPTTYIGVEIQGGAVLVDNVITGGGSGDASFSQGVYVDGTALLVNNVIYAGDEAASCTGMNIFGDSDVTLVNNIIYSGPLAMSYAGLEIEVNFTADEPVLRLFNNDIWGNYLEHLVAARYVTQFYYSDDLTNLNNCVWFGCEDASNNIYGDPLLGSDMAHISSSSPCVEAGVNPLVWYDGGFAATDIDGDARPSGEWDIGVDEVYVK